MRILKRSRWMLALTMATLICWAPLTFLLMSTTVSRLFGCPLDEATVHVCRVAGIDIGPLLSMGFVGGWLLLIAWPFMLATLIVWIVLFGRQIVKRIRARNTGT